MKKIRVILLILSILLILNCIIVNKVHAVENEWTDFSQVKVSIGDKGTMSKMYYLKFENVSMIPTNQYYVYITHDAVEPTIEYTSSATEMPKNYDYKIYDGETDGPITKKLVEYGDIYVWVLEYNSNSNKSNFVLKAKKVDRPEIAKIGSRLKAYFFNDHTTLFCNEPYIDLKRKVSIKVGKVSDTKILNSIKNGTTDCLDKLMEYAKSSKSIYTKEVEENFYKGDEKLEALAPKMGLTNKEYYYVYIVVDGEDNKYVSIEDVSLYQANVYKDSPNVTNYNLFDYLSDEFKWNVDEENKEEKKNDNEVEKKDTTVADSKSLPYTGRNIVISILIIGLIAVLIYFYNRSVFYKDIK